MKIHNTNCQFRNEPLERPQFWGPTDGIVVSQELPRHRLGSSTTDKCCKSETPVSVQRFNMSNGHKNGGGQFGVNRANWDLLERNSPSVFSHILDRHSFRFCFDLELGHDCLVKKINQMQLLVLFKSHTFLQL